MMEITTCEPKQFDFSNLDKEKYMAKIKEAEYIVPQKGIEHTAAVIDALKSITLVVKDVLADGRITIGDSKHALKVIGSVWTIAKNFTGVLPELTDLDEGEYKYIVNELVSAVFDYRRA